MPTVKLDSTFVLTASCPEGEKKVDYYDTSVTALSLRFGRPAVGLTAFGIATSTVPRFNVVELNVWALQSI